MVEAVVDGSIRPRFLDRGFHGGVGMNELASGVGWGLVDMTLRHVGPSRQNWWFDLFLPHGLACVGSGWFGRAQGPGSVRCITSSVGGGSAERTTYV
jgi:hypothetical protein